MEKNNKNSLTTGIVALVLCLITVGALIFYRLGQISMEREKWKDYDDYGWA